MHCENLHPAAFAIQNTGSLVKKNNSSYAGSRCRKHNSCNKGGLYCVPRDRLDFLHLVERMFSCRQVQRWTAIRAEEAGFPYKQRRSSSPRSAMKGFPDTESELHKRTMQVERQMTRAFDFSPYGDEASSRTSSRHVYHHHHHGIDQNSDDVTWSSAQSLAEMGQLWQSVQSKSARRRSVKRCSAVKKSHVNLFDSLPTIAQRCTLGDQPRRTTAALHPSGHEENYSSRYEIPRPQRRWQAGAAAVSVSVERRESSRVLAAVAPQPHPDQQTLWEQQHMIDLATSLMDTFMKKLMAGVRIESLEEMSFFSWLNRLSKTYGTSFMVVIVLGYCTQGFRCFPWLAMSYFFKDDLQVDPGTMQLLMSTANLPMVAKPIYGIISDSVYIKGAHRIPYLAFAGALQLLSWGLISSHADATSSVGVLTGILTITNMGAAISEVVNDALVAEAGKNKEGAQEGELQSFAWLALATGGLLGNLTGGFALQNITSQSMFSIFMVLVGAQLLLCLSVSEVSFNLGLPEDTEPAVRQNDIGNVLQEKNTCKQTFLQRGYASEDLSSLKQHFWEPAVADMVPQQVWNEQYLKPLESAKTVMEGDGWKGPVSSMHQQVTLLKGLLQKPEILQPLLWFLSSSAIIPGLGSSMFFYQTQHLRLDPSVIGLAKVVGQLGLLAGSIYYNRSLKKVPLRKLFGSVQILWGLCMLSDILLVNRINVELGIPDEYFVLGASAFVEAIGQFKILPFMVLLAQLCPSGSEGSLFAFFMSAQCLAGMMSAYLGVGLASYLHISSGSFDELPQGIFIEAMFTMLPVLWINFMPEDFKELEASTQASQHEEQVR